MKIEVKENSVFIEGVEYVKKEQQTQKPKKTYKLVNGDVVEEGDVVWYVDKELYQKANCKIEQFTFTNESSLYSHLFKTEKEADQWILDNEKRISYIELYKFMQECPNVNADSVYAIIDHFKKYA